MIIIIMMIFLRALTLLVGRQEGHLASKKLGAGLMDGGDDLTTALQVLQLQMSQPLPPALAPIKLANPGSPGKMTIKMDK